MSGDESTTKNILKVLGLALALPSTILGVGFGVFYLIEQDLVSQELGLGMLLAIMVYFFYLMVRYALNKK